MTKVLVTGATGQLGYELQRTAPNGVVVKAVSRPEFDLAEPLSIESVIQDFEPNIVVNAAAYTAVDKAESDQESAFKANGEGVAYLAELCSERGVRLLHVSTDFVFDGSADTPYEVDSLTQPIGVYGASKLQGEQAVQAANGSYAIIRTAWVYSAHGNNFVKTMLRLMAEKPELSVVADQVGTPTWANGLALACWQLALNDTENGIYHYTDEGQCSWFEFACEIQRQAIELGLLSTEIPIKAIATVDYPTPAKRPAYSVLDKSKIIESGVVVSDWKQQLNAMLKELT